MPDTAERRTHSKRSKRMKAQRLDAARKLIRAPTPEGLARGGILAGLRRSPLVGADLDVARERLARSLGR